MESVIRMTAASHISRMKIMSTKKPDWQPMEDPESWIESLSYEDAAQLRKLISDKMEREKGAAKEKLVAEFQEKLALYDLSAAEVGFGRAGGKGRKGSSDGKRAAPSGACTICNFETDPPHDGRKHRSQGDDKRPFTSKELAALEMKRV